MCNTSLTCLMNEDVNVEDIKISVMPNFLDVVTSSMNNKIEYLVKYSVAPPPCRDYYGLRILQDEVILYLWKISHGPHKAPIVHRVKFTEFSREKLLQDEIRYGFGEYLLNHVRNIAEGNRNTLLTLPRSLIGRLSRYLGYKDIVKLSSLSRITYEIFNTDLVWEILYKRDKYAKIDAREREKAEAYGWKQLYKDRQMQTSVRDRRNLRSQSSIKHANDAQTNKPSLRITNMSKSISKTVSTVNIATRQRSEFSDADLTTTSLSKTSSDIQFRGSKAKTEKEKSLPLKKSLRNLKSGSNVNEKSVKKEDLVVPRITTKRETKCISKHNEGFDKRSEKPKKYIDKSNKIKTVSQEDKTKYVSSRTSLLSKSTTGNVKSSSDLARGLQDKPRLKTKPKKVAVTSSEILNNDKTLSDDPFIVGDSNIDLADLIETSLKNIRSPPSIFNYDFSYLQRTNVTGGGSKVGHDLLDVDRSKQNLNLKSVRNVVPNYFPSKMTRGIRSNAGILEKLSEKSESYSETSTDSIVKDVKVVPENSDEFLPKKCTEARMELGKSLSVKKNDLMFSKDRGDPRASFPNKCFSPSKISNVDKKFTIRESLRNSSLKAHTSSCLENKKGFPTKSNDVL